MKKIVVIQTAFPGDVILSTPIYEALRDIYSESRAAAVVRPESACLLRGNPNIDDIIPFDKYGGDSDIAGILKMSSRLRGFDMAIIIQRHLRSALTAFLAGIPERIGFDNAWGKSLYTQRIEYQAETHEVERCLALIGVKGSSLKYRPRIYFDQETLEWAESVLLKNGVRGDFAIVAPGSVWPTKRYPHYAKVIDLINNKHDMPVVLVGSSDDAAVSKSIADSAARATVNLTGQTDLLQSAAIISKARIVISNDSAAAHMAAAVNTPVVAIFGPTVPEFGFRPYTEKSAVVDIGKLYCRPCSKHGSQQCPQRHFRCMLELGPQKVFAAVELLLGGRVDK